MLVPNRHGSSNSYRYGFQGQEKDDELKGEGNSLNYTFRMHDPRVGRFFAVDPLTKEYPHYTPYSFSGNKVIQFVEREGLEEDLGWAFHELFVSELKQEDQKTIKSAVESRNMGTIIGGCIVLGGLAAPEIATAYSSYSSWFGTTALSNYLTTSSTGMAIYSTFEAPFTFTGFFQASSAKFGIGFTTDFSGQLLTGDKVNLWSSTMSGFVGNPFYSNVFSSTGEINLHKNGKFSTTMNLFDANFTSSFTSNFIGGKVFDRFEVSSLGYKPAENALNFLTGTIIETGENKLSDEIKNKIETAKKDKEYAKKIYEGSSKPKKKGDFLANFKKK
jgi:RHS repeat-associated protein